MRKNCINPPIRGSIGWRQIGLGVMGFAYQSPYKGSIVWTTSLCQDILCLNPPIRGSIGDKATLSL